MEELLIEEKAKRYDSMFERLKEMYNNNKTNVAARLICERYFPELKECEDKMMIQYFKDLAPFDKAEELYEKYGFSHKDAIAWLEKQAEHANFRNKIQIGDKVTRNEDGVLVNLSQLNRVAKPVEPMIVGQEPLYDYTNANICQKDFAEQNPAWSEEDEKMFEHIIAKATLHFSSINYLDEEEINFLKSLKDRYTWKPSDEQIELLREVQQALLGKDCHNRFVNFMYELKRLREE